MLVGVSPSCRVAGGLVPKSPLLCFLDIPNGSRGNDALWPIYMPKTCGGQYRALSIAFWESNFCRLAVNVRFGIISA